jgi:hypothetical protein
VTSYRWNSGWECKKLYPELATLLPWKMVNITNIHETIELAVQNKTNVGKTESKIDKGKIMYFL